MEGLYIEVESKSPDHFLIDIETLVILSIYKLCNNNVKLFLKTSPKKSFNRQLVAVNLRDFKFEVITNIPEIVSYCPLPVIAKKHHVTAGICSVARQLIKSCDTKEITDLLGFREACLMACAETSVWTRFCEIDMINITKNVFENKYVIGDTLTIPPEIARFEYHLSQPVKMHNVYKIAREQNKDVIIDTKTLIKNLNINHTYSEGLYMTLADAILYPLFKIFFQKYPVTKEWLPLTTAWFGRIDKLLERKIDFEICVKNVSQVVKIDFIKRSLYIGDAPSHRTEKGIFTKQTDIEIALKMISSLEIVNKGLPFGVDIVFSWDEVPLKASPLGGALPLKRASRKCEQLENLTKAVCKLTNGKRYKIVDFCSGSGHLGILLAISLPACHVILVENKERSLVRAQETIQTLNLCNISIVQSNLDYYQGNFDVGVALHACGVATDLVLNKCIKQKAHFVLCPCCYGGIKDCHLVTYPRSREFQKLNLNEKSYLNLTHAADQTHDADNMKTKQGYLCMDVIDTDRRFFAESCGYEVSLGKLLPTTCTNKNNLLVGFYKDKEDCL